MYELGEVGSGRRDPRGTRELSLASLPCHVLTSKKVLGHALPTLCIALRWHMANILSLDVDDAPGPCATTRQHADANAHPGRRSSAAHSVMGCLHHSKAIPFAETTNRPALSSMVAASISRARICTFITSQCSAAVSIDHLHCHCEVFWSILESCMLMGWFPIGSCWVVHQHLTWLSVIYC